MLVNETDLQMQGSDEMYCVESWGYKTEILGQLFCDEEK